MTSRLLAFASSATLAATLSSCATQQSGLPRDPNLTNENSATVVVYRPNTSFHRLDPELPFLYVNGQQVGKLAINSAIEIRVPVGEHALSMKEPLLFMPAYESRKVALKAEPGKTYFVRYSRELAGVILAAGGVLSKTDFDLVPEEIGRQRR
jgi:hypothetical protein